MPFDWRASPQTAQMFGPTGMLAPFYARRAQQFELLQQQQQRGFQERQQRAAFDYAKGLTEYRQRLQETSPLFQPQVQAAEAEAEQATMQSQAMGRVVDLQMKVQQLQQEGKWDEAADVWQAGQMPQAAEMPEMRYLVSPTGEELGQFPGPITVAREPAGAAGALTPSQALTGQNQSISRFGAELDERPASKIIQKRTGGKKTLNEFFALFSGKYTPAKERLLNEILVEMIEKGDVPKGTTIESHPILSAARNLLEYGKVIAGGKVESTLEGKPAPLFP